MKAKLNNLHSVDFDLSSYWPDDPAKFGFWLRAIVGPADKPGEESFDIFVCTPEWIKERCSSQKAIWGRHMLIVMEYDVDAIRSRISTKVESYFADDWPRLAEQLSRIGAWEFEDYKH